MAAQDWNDPITQETDWSHIDFVKRFWEALEDRMVAMGYDDGDLWLIPEEEDDVQYAGNVIPRWAAPVSITRSGFTVTLTASTTHGLQVGHLVRVRGCAQSEYNRVWRIQTVPTSASMTFFTTATPASPATAASGETIEWRSAMISIQLMQTQIIGMLNGGFGFIRNPGTWVPGSSSQPEVYSQSTFFEDLGAPPSQGFQRKRPREITLNSSGLTAATTDSQGNTIAVGMKALNLSASFGTRGRVYECTAVAASTTWALNTTEPPDMLDSWGSAPDLVVGGANSVMAAGDYIGPWVWEQLRDGFNLMLERLGAQSAGLTGATIKTAQEDPAPPVFGTWAGAQTSAEGNYPDGTTPFNSFDRNVFYFGAGGSDSGGNPAYSAAIQSWHTTESLDQKTNGMNCEVRWYVRGDPPETADLVDGFSSDELVYDDNGLGYTNGAYDLVYGPETISAPAGSTVASPKSFGLDAIPTAPDAPVRGDADLDERARGFRWTMFTIQKWNVSGGFRHVP
jgi:hypothetical protein